MNQERYTYLLQGWLKEQLSAQEVDEFLHALQDNTFVDYVGADIVQSLSTGKFDHQEISEEKQKGLVMLMNRISGAQPPASPPKKIARFIGAKRLAAAAILIGLGMIGYFIFSKQEYLPSEPGIVREKIDYPVINQAVITFPDGTQLRVDTISSALTLDQYGIRIEKTASGQLLYTSISSDQAFVPLPVKIENPRGSTPLHIQLTDGSDVWLNAQTVMSYPVVFAANKREVMISGEAYFEVAKNPAKKFMVKTSGLTTEVLGTHFDVKAYEDEASSKVTLLEGSLKVYASQSAAGNIITPSQQAVVANEKVKIVDADIQHVMAWKNDLLSFNSADIKTIMLEIGRWYDVEVVYTPATPDKKFSGYISRQTSLAELLEIIKQSGFNVKTEGRKVYVLPN